LGNQRYGARLLVLRDWQAQYNPLAEPTPWLTTADRRRINAKILKSRGTQCFLFRKASGGPLSTHFCFESTLPALLFQIQREGENLAAAPSDPLPQRFISPYTPHSLRVSAQR
jgi:hypothetical protein